jgi:hypothetical protein
MTENTVGFSSTRRGSSGGITCSVAQYFSDGWKRRRIFALYKRPLARVLNIVPEAG